MNTRSIVLAVLVAATALVVIGGAFADDGAKGSAPAAAQIEAAKTPADQEAMAKVCRGGAVPGSCAGSARACG